MDRSAKVLPTLSFLIGFGDLFSETAQTVAVAPGFLTFWKMTFRLMTLIRLTLGITLILNIVSVCLETTRFPCLLIDF